MTANLIVLTKSFDLDQIRGMASGTGPVLLLLDDVNQASAEQLDELQDEVLVPLAQRDDVLIVVTERGRPHYWDAIEFREESIEHDLQPFERHHIKEQVEKQAPDTRADLDEIERLGAGYPCSTYILARNLPEPTALDLCVAQFLEDGHAALLDYLTALCVLQAFDESRMGHLLPFLSPEFAGQSWEYDTCRHVLKQLLNSSLCQWSQKARGYVIDEPLRRALEARLHERDNALWERLHRAAHQLYAEWSGEFEQSREWWMQEKRYHENRLSDAVIEPQASPTGEGQEEEGENDG